MLKQMLAAHCLVLVCASAGLAFSARVQRVHDGDSISVQDATRRVLTIRLYGIDAPEARQPHGQQARKRLAKLVSRQGLDIEPMDTDRYGRTVALLRLPDGALVNEIMVAEGMAWVYGEYCRQPGLCLRLAELQADARRQRRGLWAGASPQRPAQWRREHKAEEWRLTPVRALKHMARRMTPAAHK